MYTVIATLDGRPIFLAQPEVSEQTKSDTKDEGKKEGGEGGFFSNPTMLIVIVGMMVLWIFLLGGGSRKQKKKQQAMLSAMSKGSKIVTIGGIKGSVVEVRDEEVVVKVDENNNTRMKFSRDAIRTVVDENAAKDDKADKPDKSDKSEKNEKKEK